MADATTIVVLRQRALTASETGAVEAAISPRTNWQPALVLESGFDTQLAVSTSGLAASGDMWYIACCPPSAMPGYMFYPISARIQSRAGDLAGFDSFWELACGFAINPPYGRPLAWDSLQLDAVRRYYEGSGIGKFQTGNPSFHGFPVRYSAVESATVAQNALIAFSLEVQTWDAATAAGCVLGVDVRILAFPVGVRNSAGFYMPRLGYVPP